MPVPKPTPAIPVTPLPQGAQFVTVPSNKLESSRWGARGKSRVALPIRVRTETNLPSAQNFGLMDRIPQWDESGKELKDKLKQGQEYQTGLGLYGLGATNMAPVGQLITVPGYEVIPPTQTLSQPRSGSGLQAKTPEQLAELVAMSARQFTNEPLRIKPELRNVEIVPAIERFNPDQYARELLAATTLGKPWLLPDLPEPITETAVYNALDDKPYPWKYVPPPSPTPTQHPDSYQQLVGHTPDGQPIYETRQFKTQADTTVTTPVITEPIVQKAPQGIQVRRPHALPLASPSTLHEVGSIAVPDLEADPEGGVARMIPKLNMYGEQVVDGSQPVSLTDVYGSPVSANLIPIVSNRKLARETLPAIKSTGEVDPAGKPSSVVLFQDPTQLAALQAMRDKGLDPVEELEKQGYTGQQLIDLSQGVIRVPDNSRQLDAFLSTAEDGRPIINFPANEEGKVVLRGGQPVMQPARMAVTQDNALRNYWQAIRKEGADAGKRTTPRLFTLQQIIDEASNEGYDITDQSQLDRYLNQVLKASNSKKVAESGTLGQFLQHLNAVTEQGTDRRVASNRQTPFEQYVFHQNPQLVDYINQFSKQPEGVTDTQSTPPLESKEAIRSRLVGEGSVQEMLSVPIESVYNEQEIADMNLARQKEGKPPIAQGEMVSINNPDLDNTVEKEYLNQVASVTGEGGNNTLYVKLYETDGEMQGRIKKEEDNVAALLQKKAALARGRALNIVGTPDPDSIIIPKVNKDRQFYYDIKSPDQTLDVVYRDYDKEVRGADRFAREEQAIVDSPITGKKVALPLLAPQGQFDRLHREGDPADVYTKVQKLQTDPIEGTSATKLARQDVDDTKVHRIVNPILKLGQNQDELTGGRQPLYTYDPELKTYVRSVGGNLVDIRGQRLGYNALEPTGRMEDDLAEIASVGDDTVALPTRERTWEEDYGRVPNVYDEMPDGDSLYLSRNEPGTYMPDGLMLDPNTGRVRDAKPGMYMQDNYGNDVEFLRLRKSNDPSSPDYNQFEFVNASWNEGETDWHRENPVRYGERGSYPETQAGEFDPYKRLDDGDFQLLTPDAQELLPNYDGKDVIWTKRLTPQEVHDLNKESELDAQLRNANPNYTGDTRTATWWSPNAPDNAGIQQVEGLLRDGVSLEKGADRQRLNTPLSQEQQDALTKLAYEGVVRKTPMGDGTFTIRRKGGMAPIEQIAHAMQVTGNVQPLPPQGEIFYMNDRGQIESSPIKPEWMRKADEVTANSPVRTQQQTRYTKGGLPYTSRILSQNLNPEEGWYEGGQTQIWSTQGQRYWNPADVARMEQAQEVLRAGEGSNNWVYDYGDAEGNTLMRNAQTPNLLRGGLQQRAKEGFVDWEETNINPVHWVSVDPNSDVDSDVERTNRLTPQGVDYYRSTLSPEVDTEYPDVNVPGVKQKTGSTTEKPVLKTIPDRKESPYEYLAHRINQAAEQGDTDTVNALMKGGVKALDTIDQPGRGRQTIYSDTSAEARAQRKAARAAKANAMRQAELEEAQKAREAEAQWQQQRQASREQKLSNTTMAPVPAEKQSRAIYRPALNDPESVSTALAKQGATSQIALADNRVQATKKALDSVNKPEKYIELPKQYGVNFRQEHDPQAKLLLQQQNKEVASIHRPAPTPTPAYTPTTPTIRSERVNERASEEVNRVGDVNRIAEQAAQVGRAGVGGSGVGNPNVSKFPVKGAMVVGGTALATMALNALYSNQRDKEAERQRQMQSVGGW